MTTMVKTPKGIMYLIEIRNALAFCYDDQTGMERRFWASEVRELFSLTAKT